MLVNFLNTPLKASLLLFSQIILTFLTKQFAIAYTNRENGQINEIKAKFANFTA